MLMSPIVFNRAMPPVPLLNYVKNLGKDYVPIYYPKRLNLLQVLEGNILINQSPLVLTDCQIEVLSMGLGFVPPITRPPSDRAADFDAALKHWSRSVDISLHFATVDSSFTSQKGWLGKLIPSTWDPPAGPWRDQLPSSDAFHFASAVFNPDENVSGVSAPDPVTIALDQLAKQQLAHIMKADKGRCTVLWSVEAYDREARFQLDDATKYKEISETEYRRRLRALADRCALRAQELYRHGHLTARECEAMEQVSAESGSTIYFLPKIHKGANPATDSFHGRPIVATYSSPVRFIDKYLTALTAPILALIPGSLRDTKDLVTLLTAPFTPPLSINAVVVTADVDGLYPNVPWDDAINAAVEFYHSKRDFLREYAVSHHLPPPPSAALFAENLSLVLKDNYIHFKNKAFFHQESGTAMGMCISVYLANAYMYQITRPHIEKVGGPVRLFLRYIDDILVIFDGATPEDIAKFFKDISNEFISYTIDVPRLEQAFLDIYVFIDPETRLMGFRPYWKATASGSYLSPMSCHPPHIIKAVPFSQFLRLRRISSSKELFQAASQRLSRDLKRSGYSKQLIADSISRAETYDWNRPQQRGVSESFRFITRFGPHIEDSLANKAVRALLDLVRSQYQALPPSTNVQAQVVALERRSAMAVFRNARTVGSYFSASMKRGNVL